MELKIFSPSLLEYEAELPPFPEEYKIKPETVITVSIAPPQPKLKALNKNSTDRW